MTREEWVNRYRDMPAREFLEEMCLSCHIEINVPTPELYLRLLDWDKSVRFYFGGDDNEEHF